MPAKSARAPIRRKRDLRGKHFCATLWQSGRKAAVIPTERTMKNGKNDLREAALALLRRTIEPFHIQHALTVEAVMLRFANDLGYGKEADFWAMCGLLHDIDFEKWPEPALCKSPGAAASGRGG